MTLVASCEKHAPKELLNFLKEVIKPSRKMKNSHKIKEYKTRSQEIKLAILSSMIYSILVLELWYKYCTVIVDIT